MNGRGLTNHNYDWLNMFFVVVDLLEDMGRKDVNKLITRPLLLFY